MVGAVAEADWSYYPGPGSAWASMDAAPVYAGYINLKNGGYPYNYFFVGINGNKALVIDNEGSVGIGTYTDIFDRDWESPTGRSGPQAALEVHGDEARVSNVGGTGGLLILDGRADGSTSIGINAYGGTPALHIRNSSDAILATIEDEKGIEIRGNTHEQEIATLSFYDNAGNTQMGKLEHSIPWAAWIASPEYGMVIKAKNGGYSRNYMKFQVNDLDGIVIDYAGNVGIGTGISTFGYGGPQAKLDVVGDIQAKDVYVEIDTDDDGLADTFYSLRDIAELVLAEPNWAGTNPKRQGPK